MIYSKQEMYIKTELMVQYAWQFIKTPYLWGGSYPTGYDCSGFIQEVLASVGLDIQGDQTAQQLFDYYKTRWELKTERGSLVFFGKSHTEVSHIALAVDSLHMIEAGGGNHDTINLQEAIKRNAFIRVRPISNRRDFILGLYPTRSI